MTGTKARFRVELGTNRQTSGVMLMQRGANPAISNGRGQKAVELCSDVWLREAIGSYTEHWERHGRKPGWTPPTPQPDDVEVPRRNQSDIVTLILCTLFHSFDFIFFQVSKPCML